MVTAAVQHSAVLVYQCDSVLMDLLLKHGESRVVEGEPQRRLITLLLSKLLWDCSRQLAAFIKDSDRVLIPLV